MTPSCRPPSLWNRSLRPVAQDAPPVTYVFGGRHLRRMPFPSLLVVFSTLLIGCTTGHEPGRPEGKPDSAQASNAPKLQGEVVAEGDFLGRPMQVEISGNNLWVADFSGDPWIHLFDLRSGAHVASVGRKGQGPGEYQSILGFFRDSKSPGDLWVFDANGGRLTKLAGEAGTVEVKESRRLPATAGFPLLVTPAVDGFVAMVPDSSVAWVRFDASTRPIGKISGTMLGADTIPLAARLHHSQTVHVCSRPDGDKFAVVYYGAGRVEIRNGNGEFQVNAKVPLPSEPEFKVSLKTGLPTWTRTKSQYSNCAGTNGRLYALYAGKDDRQLPDKTRPIGSDEGNQIHVFDWDGNFLGAVQLTEEIVALAVTQNDSLLYGASAQRVRVWKFPLNGVRP